MSGSHCVHGSHLAVNCDACTARDIAAIAPIPRCATCGRPAFVVDAGIALCAADLAMLACSRKVLAATAVQVPERSGWIHRDHAPEVPRG